MAHAILHPGQSEVFRDLFVDRKIRNAVAVCSRGWGKSHLAGVSVEQAINELMQLDESVPNKTVFIIAPTYSQVTDIYHPLLMYQLGISRYSLKDSKDAGRIWFPRNVELRMVSFEAVERMRGHGAYYVVNDEVRDWTKGNGFKEAWQSIIQPCIATRWGPKRAKEVGAVSPGRSLTISTPKGYDFLYDMYNYQEQNPDEWKSYSYDYKTSPLLDPDEIEMIRHQIDPIKFAREYLASFNESGNSVFYCFDRKIHVRRDLPPFRQGTAEEPGEDVHIGIDFNVGLQCSSAFAIRGKQVHYLHEFTGQPDTERLALSIKAKYWPNFNRHGHPEYGKKVCKIYVYPDPTGRARKTSAVMGQTDFSILESHGLITRAHTGSPPIVDSVNAVNRMLKTAAGEVHMYFSPDVPGVIASMERTSWVDRNPDTATIDKKNGEEHFSDGVRYPIEYLFPVLVGKKTVHRGFNF
jgi:hypothetical protein